MLHCQKIAQRFSDRVGTADTAQAFKAYFLSNLGVKI